MHGIRGGPFVTWRRVRTAKTLDPNTGNLQMAVPDMRHDLCWPTVWLKADVPGARLLSLEYAAPASGWEVQLFLLAYHQHMQRPAHAHHVVGAPDIRRKLMIATLLPSLVAAVCCA